MTAKSNDDLRILIRSSKIAVSVHAR